MPPLTFELQQLINPIPSESLNEWALLYSSVLQENKTSMKTVFFSSLFARSLFLSSSFSVALVVIGGRLFARVSPHPATCNCANVQLYNCTVVQLCICAIVLLHIVILIVHLTVAKSSQVPNFYFCYQVSWGS